MTIEKQALHAIVEAAELEKQKPAKFLKAWKQGIKLVGEEFFNITSTVDTATHIDELRPNKEMLEQNLYRLSTGQALFLAAMYSFFDSQDGQLFLEQLERPNICDIASRLEKEYLEIILVLMANYHGW